MNLLPLHSRSINIIKNISLGMILKIVSLILSFLVVPATINYLNSEKYGIWVTLLSILSWISFFDIGLGNGLRNKLTQALSTNDIIAAREFVSTAYAAIALIVFALIAITQIAIPFINWNRVFNTSVISGSDFSNILSTIFLFVLLNFILSICNQLFYAVQKSAIAGINILLVNIFQLIGVYILKLTTDSNILYLAIVYGISIIFASILMTIYFFISHRYLMPGISFVKPNRIKEIMSLGYKFFIIQIAAVIIFTTDNMIITQVLGPSEVTSYNVVLKLFSVLTIFSTMIFTPLWSAYTDAFARGDYKWIINIIKKLNMFMIIVIVASVLIAIFSKYIISMWIGDGISISKYLVLFMAIYTVISIWNNIYAYFLNGIGNINLSLTVSIISALVNIPISIYLSKNFGLGNAGVIMGTIISLSPGVILGPAQTYYILARKNRWNH